MAREAKIERKTKETEISLFLSLDKAQLSDIETGVGFLDHMLITFCHHGGFHMGLVCKGDLKVDCHHTVEDIGIVLGKAFKEALGDKKGIRRFGNARIPMDEALVSCDLDISNRPYLVFNVDFKSDKLGDLDSQMVEEFFYAFAINSGTTLHINEIYGSNDHHICEAVFKSFAHAMKSAVFLSDSEEILSTKGCL